MAYLEKNFQTDFNKYVKHRFKETAAFELKAVTTQSIPFSRVADHQVNALLQAKHGCLIYKIPDDSRGHKPLDSFAICHSPAYVVVMFEASRKSPFYLIDIDDWISESESSDRRSLLQTRAAELGREQFLFV